LSRAIEAEGSSVFVLVDALETVNDGVGVGGGVIVRVRVPSSDLVHDVLMVMLMVSDPLDMTEVCDGVLTMVRVLVRSTVPDALMLVVAVVSVERDIVGVNVVDMDMMVLESIIEIVVLPEATVEGVTRAWTEGLWDGVREELGVMSGVTVTLADTDLVLGDRVNCVFPLVTEIVLIDDDTVNVKALRVTSVDRDDDREIEVVSEREWAPLALNEYDSNDLVMIRVVVFEIDSLADGEAVEEIDGLQEVDKESRPEAETLVLRENERLSSCETLFVPVEDWVCETLRFRVSTVGDSVWDCSTDTDPSLWDDDLETACDIDGERVGPDVELVGVIDGVADASMVAVTADRVALFEGVFREYVDDWSTEADGVTIAALDMDMVGVTSKDLDGVVLRTLDGVREFEVLVEEEISLLRVGSDDDLLLVTALEDDRVGVPEALIVCDNERDFALREASCVALWVTEGIAETDGLTVTDAEALMDVVRELSHVEDADTLMFDDGVPFAL
jgi:hypothetical protein